MEMLKGKVAIITGATSGIGRRSVERFVEEGARVMCCGRRAELGATLEKALGPEHCRFVRADVTEEADIERLIAACLKEWGRIDCLFNNAGGPAPQGGIEATPVAGFDAAFATLVRLSNCVAMQLGEQNVRVNCISPGGIATGIFAKSFGLSGEAADKTAEAVKAGLAKLQPIPRAGITDDIANAAVFFASDQSNFINGHNLVVDGGLIGGRQWSVLQTSLAGMKQAFGL